MSSRRFGAVRVPLLNKTKALSWRGVPYELRDRVVRELRRYPISRRGSAGRWARGRSAKNIEHDLDFAHHTWFAHRTFERIAIPFCSCSRGLIGTLQEIK
jgi:hypothetical protein